MHSPDDEPRLREAFDDLRRADAAKTPPFHRTWRAAQGRVTSRSRPFAFAFAALSLVLMCAAIVHRLQPPAPVVTIVSMSSTSWSAPTDFLLDTPGRALATTVPAFNPVPDYGKDIR